MYDRRAIADELEKRTAGLALQNTTPDFVKGALWMLKLILTTLRDDGSWTEQQGGQGDGTGAQV